MPVLHAGIRLNTAAFDPEGGRLASGGADGLVRLWGLGRGTVAHRLFPHSGLSIAMFSPKGDRILTAGMDGTARVWDPNTGAALTPPMAHARAVLRATFDSQGLRVLTASEDRTARVWDAATGLPITPPLVHRHRVWDAAFIPNSSRIVTVSGRRPNVYSRSLAGPTLPTHALDGDGPDEAIVWDLDTATPAYPPLPHGGTVVRVAADPTGRILATSGTNRLVHLWEATTGAPLFPPLETEECTVGSLSFSQDGRTLATACGGVVQLWDTTSGQAVSPRSRATGSILWTTFSADQRRHMIGSDIQARIWDTTRGEPLLPPFVHHHNAQSGAFSHDGLMVATTSLEQPAHVWDAQTGGLVARLHNQSTLMPSVRFHPDDASVLTTDTDGMATLWFLPADPRPDEELRRIAEILACRRFDPDSTSLVALSRDEFLDRWEAQRAHHPGAVGPAVGRSAPPLSQR